MERIHKQTYISNVVHGVLHEAWVLHELVDRLPNVDGTPKYCQNALEIAVGSYMTQMHGPTATSKAFWQYFGVLSILGRRSISLYKTQALCKTPCTTLIKVVFFLKIIISL